MPSLRTTLFSDPKISTKHQTIIDGAIPTIDMLRKLNSVTKIIIGPIQPNKSSTPRIKPTSIRNGVHIKIQTTNAIQQFYIYTKQPHVITHHLTHYN